MGQFKELKSATFQGIDAFERSEQFIRNNITAIFVSHSFQIDMTSGAAVVNIVFTSASTVDTTGVDNYIDYQN